jgi:integrase
VAIGPRAQAVIGPWLDGKDGPAFVFSPAADFERQQAERRARRRVKLWPSHAARPRKTEPGRARLDHYTVRSYRRAIYRACKRAGVDRWHPHRLRHAAEVDIEAAFDLDAGRAVLGHRHVKTTARYGIADVKRAAEVMRKVG